MALAPNEYTSCDAQILADSSYSTNSLSTHLQRSSQPFFPSRTGQRLFLIDLPIDVPPIDSAHENITVSRLNMLKRYLGATDDDLASILAISRKTLNNWRQNDRKPHKPNLLRLISVHKLVSTWLSNGYPTIANLEVTDKDLAFRILKQDNIDIDAFLYFGSSLMLSKEASEIEDPFAS